MQEGPLFLQVCKIWEALEWQTPQKICSEGRALILSVPICTFSNHCWASEPVLNDSPLLRLLQACCDLWRWHPLPEVDCYLSSPSLNPCPDPIDVKVSTGLHTVASVWPHAWSRAEYNKYLLSTVPLFPPLIPCPTHSCPDCSIRTSITVTEWLRSLVQLIVLCPVSFQVLMLYPCKISYWRS